MKAAFDIEDYKERQMSFPEIGIEEFDLIDDMDVRKDIVRKNKIISTDAYNRTMNHLKGNEKSRQEETYTLTFRRSPNKAFNIVYGVRNIIKKIIAKRFTQTELDFAKGFYQRQKELGANGYFDANLWQGVIDNGGYLPLTIMAVEDGTMLRPGEPVMTIRGPAELAAVFEPELLRVFFQSVVATDMHFIEQIIGEGRVVEMGKRASSNDDAHMDAVEALYVGGGVRQTSNDRAAAAIPQVNSAGTTAHRYFACYSTEEEAFRNAIEKTDKIALLVDLVDSYRGIDKIIELKKEYRERGKIIWMRLDSGDLVDQALYALKKQQAAGMLDPARDKIIVADVSDVDKIREIENKVREAGFDPKDYIVYGLGGLLVAKNKLRDVMSAAFKLTKTAEFDTGKLSNDEGKIAIPGDLNLEIRKDGRYIVQSDEKVRGERLLKLVYDNGRLLFRGNDIEAIENARKRVSSSERYINLPTKKSRRTERLCREVKDRFLAAA